MTALDPRVTLTEAEVERLYANDPGAYLSQSMVDAIADLIAARLAPIRAVLDACDETKTATVMITAVRAALDAPVSASQDHDGAVHNHPPYEPTCNERRVGGRLRGACLNDDGSPR